MPVGLAGWKACRHARSEELVPGISDECNLPFQDVDELILMRVPVALRGPAAGGKGHEIDPELGDAESIVQRTFLAAPERLAELRGIDAAASRRHPHRIEPGPARFFGLLHRWPQADSALAWVACSFRLASIWAIASSTASNTRSVEACCAL